jgi:hypothetical protein
MTSDLERARKIVARYKSFPTGPGGLRDNVAAAVAEGIALGRKEGLDLAQKALQKVRITIKEMQDLEKHEARK